MTWLMRWVVIGFWSSVLFFSSLTAQGIHVHLPRGVNSAIDTVAIDAGDLMKATRGNIDSLYSTFLNHNGTELTTTFGEINTALSGAPSTVSTANLTELTDGSTTALHEHAGGASAADTLIGIVIDGRLQRPTQYWTEEYDGSGCGNCKSAGRQMAVYMDSLFFLDDRGTYGEVGMWDGTNTPVLSWYAPASVHTTALETWNDFLYLGLGDGAGKGDIRRYSRETDAWVEVGTNLAEVIYDFEVAHDSLYAGTGTIGGSATIQVSADGINWSASYSGGATIREAGAALVNHQGVLYASLNTSSLGSDIIYNAGNNWETLGSPASGHRIIALGSYDGHLWAGSDVSSGTASVYYYDEESSSWILAVTLATNTKRVYDFQEYRGRLYVAVGDASFTVGSIKVFEGTAYNDSIFGWPVSGFSEGAVGLHIYREALISGWGDYRGGTSGAGDIYSYYEDHPDWTIRPRSPMHHTDRFISHQEAIFEDSARFRSGVAVEQSVMVWSGAESPTASVNSAHLWAERLGGGAMELYGLDGAGNKSPITSNVEVFPVALAVSPTRPYVTQTENIWTDRRTYIATHRLAELVQLLAREAGYLEADKYVIMHVDRHAPNTLLPPGAEKSMRGRTLWDRLTGEK